MVRQTVFLFIRALIFGVLINIGLQQISDTPPDQQEVVAPQQIQDQAIQSSPETKANILEQVDQ